MSHQESVVTYGPGGFDAAKPNSNVVAERTVEVPDDELIRQAQQDRALAAIDGLRQIKNSTSTLSAAQLSNAVRLLATVVLVLLRNLYGRFEEDD
jgi:hypothetical protein